MKQIQTGKGAIPLISLFAIWSLSMVVNLPGLAISPLMSNLSTIFPHTSVSKIFLLTVLPNLFIIPFILLSGKLSVSKDKILLVVIGLSIYLASGIGYFFAKDMTSLIVLSCALGVGCGIVIPLSAGLLAEFFEGQYRMKQLGIKSGIANFSLVIATLLVGWLGGKNWHLPFVVYLTPLIPLLLSPFLSRNHLKTTESAAAPAESGSKNSGQVPLPNAAQVAQVQQADNVSKSSPASASADSVAPPQVQTVVPDDIMNDGQAYDDGSEKFVLAVRNPVKTLWGLIFLYFTITFGVAGLNYYLPFLMQGYKMTTGETGIVTSLFFLFITIPGFTLSQVMKSLQHRVSFTCVALMMLGLFMIAFSNIVYVFCLGAAVMGFGYGVLQPLIYDKVASLFRKKPERQTLNLSYIFTANYLAVVAAPFVIDFFMKHLHITSYVFPFVFNGMLLLLLAFIALVFRRSPTFAVDASLYENND
jgi:Major Facilitator Superfamily.